MEVTLSLQDIGVLFIGIGLIVLIIYGIILLKNLVQTVKTTNKILEDSHEISAIAAERTKEINSIVGDVAHSMGAVNDAFKGNQNVIKALTSIVNSLGALRSIFGSKQK
jgi:uncharacterized protein YoxC